MDRRSDARLFPSLSRSDYPCGTQSSAHYRLVSTATTANAPLLDLPPIRAELAAHYNLSRIAGVAATEVDYISVGALTASAPVVDLVLHYDAAH